MPTANTTCWGAAGNLRKAGDCASCFVLLPMLILDLAAMFLVLDRVQTVTHSRAAFAISDSVLAVGGQLETVAALLMYLGTAQKRVTKLKP